MVTVLLGLYMSLKTGLMLGGCCELELVELWKVKTSNAHLPSS